MDGMMRRIWDASDAEIRGGAALDHGTQRHQAIKYEPLPLSHICQALLVIWSLDKLFGGSGK